MLEAAEPIGPEGACVISQGREPLQHAAHNAPISPERGGRSRLSPLRGSTKIAATSIHGLTPLANDFRLFEAAGASFGDPLVRPVLRELLFNIRTPDARRQIVATARDRNEIAKAIGGTRNQRLAPCRSRRVGDSSRNRAILFSLERGRTKRQRTEGRKDREESLPRYFLRALRELLFNARLLPVFFRTKARNLGPLASLTTHWFGRIMFTCPRVLLPVRS